MTMQGEIRPGYKQTEVGVIPEDWDELPLGSLFNFKNGLNKAKEFFGHGTPIVNYMDVFNQSGLQSVVILGRVDVSRDELKAYEVRQGDVFFTRTSETVEEIGIASAMIGEVQDTVFSGFILRARPVDDSLDNEFKRYCFSVPYFRQQVTMRASYTTRALTNGRSLSAALLARPPLPEQRAIAAALSDADALIAALEAMIAKKRDLKQAAMQHLLTGKTRLPGFSAEWEVKTIEDAMDCYDNFRVPLNDAQRSKMKGDIPYCGANGVVGTVNDYVIDDDIILVAEDGGYFDEYRTRPIAYRMIGKCWVNNHAHILKAKQGFDQGFLFYSLVHKDIQAFLASGTRAKLNKSEMWKISTPIPNDLVEQSAIAEVLSDMDADLAALEAQAAKARAVKQGMMQELLTGRVRLV